MNNYTIVLAHGIARFDFLVQQFSKDLGKFGLNFGLAANELNYFKGIARHLRSEGFNVYQSTVGFAARVDARAADLKNEVETALALRPDQSKVHIIGHSMGGLDARHMIVNLGMSDKVASLTTIGTPHRGTSFADWGMANEGDEIIEILSRCLDIRGFADLTTEQCRAFNEAAESAEAANQVFYQAYASFEEETKVFRPLKASWRIISEAEGNNDGLVSRTSQHWTDQLTDGNGNHKPVHQKDFPVSADHLNEVGWWDFEQFEPSDLFHIDRLNFVRSYENKIKDVYLEIARSVQILP